MVMIHDYGLYSHAKITVKLSFIRQENRGNKIFLSIIRIKSSCRITFFFRISCIFLSLAPSDTFPYAAGNE